MNVSQLTSTQLRQLAKLVEAKEALLAKVAKLDAQLMALAGPSHKPAPKRHAKKRAKRGQVKGAIVRLLKQSGKKGVTVREIAAKLGLGNNRVHTWFYNAQKSLKQIKKAGPGKYRWAE
jgi:hypothetical protein